MKTLIFTCGDINGIGPEISIKAINKLFNPAKRKIVFIIPLNVFTATSKFVTPVFPIKVIKKENVNSLSSSFVSIIDLGNTKQNIGKPTIISGKTSAKAIEISYEISKLVDNSAIITSPISKSAFELASIKYSGQTEYYAELNKRKKFMMMFLSKKMICGLSTIHIPIKDVAKKLTAHLLESKIELLIKSIKEDLGKQNPKIAVLGLNPHSGEEGRIGREEIEIIIPVIRKHFKENVFGPFVPDAFFATKQFLEYDACLGMYHDQVLIPFKMLNFESGVNYTAGLDIIRVSPDHGTAYDIAGKGIASPLSIIAAAKWGEKIITNRAKYNAS